MAYELVMLASGVRSIHSVAHGETFHPVIGPAAEAEALYVRQLQLRERIAQTAGEFVIWDVGLGAAANVLTTLSSTQDIAGQLRIISFDNTTGPLAFALKNSAALGYFGGHEDHVAELLAKNHVRFQNGKLSVNWEFHPGDFPGLLTASKFQDQKPPPPHAIFYDAYSPAKNPAMWTLPHFTNLFQQLDPLRPCSLPTYSRSTILRVTLLLAGFFVGVGHATGFKEETTLAANDPGLLAEPLDLRWLDRARRSHSAEPMDMPVYRIAPLSPENWERLQAHPQFQL